MDRHVVRSIKAMVPLLGIVFTLMPVHAEAAFPGGNGKIAFIGESARYDGRIFIMNADASGVTVIGSRTRNHGKPAFSPDGTQLAYVWYSKAGTALVISDAETTNETTVLASRHPGVGPGGIDPDSLAWSPDGTHLVFGRYNSVGYTNLYTVGTDGLDPTRLSAKDQWDSEPAWSNDGTTIAFITYDSEFHWTLAIMNSDGTGRTLLPIGGLESVAFNPDWAPDDSSIVFEQIGPGQSNLYTIHPDGNALTQVTSTGAHSERYPAFSPDGSTIVFSRARHTDGAWDLWTVPATGGTQTRLTDSPKHYESEPDWQAT